jgi:tetraacyldisaccharide 4'-kinase
VAWLANVLVSRGRKPCVLSRGYRSREGGNDEARVLAELCPGVTLREDPDRLRGARACAEAGADVVVLDDGFSHLRLARDLDIVLIDALDPFGGGYLLPRGLLREPLSGLRRAGAVIVTRADLATEQRLRELDDVIKCHGMTGPIAHARHEPLALVPLEGGQAREPGWLAGRTVAAFCGIGNPAGFAATLEALGARLARPMFALEDHAAYDPRQLAALNAHLDTSRQAGAELAICTQKDAVKLRGRLAEPALPVFELRVGFRVTRDEQALLGLIERALEGR